MVQFTQLHSSTKLDDCNISARMDTACLSVFEAGKISYLQARPLENVFLILQEGYVW